MLQRIFSGNHIESCHLYLMNDVSSSLGSRHNIYCFKFESEHVSLAYYVSVSVGEVVSNCFGVKRLI